MLTVIGGADRGKSIQLSGGETRIGRGLDQDLVLADIAASRRHTLVLVDGERYRLRDLGSGNGTLVNGQRVDSVLLADGDQVEIGNTLLRFDHPPSKGRDPGAAVPAPMAREEPPPAVPPPEPAETPLDPAPFVPAQPPAADAPGGETPSDAVSLPVAAVRARPAAPAQRPARVLLDTPLKLGAVFGTMALISVVSLIVIARAGRGSAEAGVSEAEEQYRQGLRLFIARDFEGGKVAFAEVLRLAPDSVDASRYERACDLEISARAALKTAERSLQSRRFSEAVRALDGVDKASVLHDQAQRLRRETAPRAALELLEEARRVSSDDPQQAATIARRALELDPASPEVRAFLDGSKTESSDRSTRSERSSHRSASPRAEARGGARDAGRGRRPEEGDEDLAPVKVSSRDRGREVDASRSSGAQMVSLKAMGAYKSRDFVEAERVMRAEAAQQGATPAGQRATEIANSVKQLKQLVDGATADEARNPTAAVKSLEQALALDAKLGRGALASFLKARLGSASLAAAQQTFALGKFEETVKMVQLAQRSGAGDGGMSRQLELKANELVQKGQAAAKSNPAQAKQYWRTVLKIVPSSSSSYVQAYKLLNEGTRGGSDEDEN